MLPAETLHLTDLFVVVPWTVATNWILPPAVVAAGSGVTAIELTNAVVAAWSVSGCGGTIPTQPERIKTVKAMAAEIFADLVTLYREVIGIEIGLNPLFLAFSISAITVKRSLENTLLHLNLLSDTDRNNWREEQVEYMCETR